MTRSILFQIHAHFGEINFIQLDKAKFTTARRTVVEATKNGLTMLTDEIIKSSAQANFIPFPSLGFPGNTPSRLVKGNVGKLREMWRAKWDKTVKVEWAEKNGQCAQEK
ncbi:hypothetical protein N0V88_004921 [Collariella sp. IMI 366227]|nr:hypothetical protein N0V88_004921 [Collariella sp. IMI 366227]